MVVVIASTGCVQFSIRHAASTPELRAAAYLRASSFYSYPEGRSEFAKRAHMRMKADAAWEGLEARVRGGDAEYESVVVTPLIAAMPLAPDDPVAAAAHASLEDRSCILPAEGALQPQVVIGTLDINICAKLPAEELIGQLPREGDRSKLCAYLSNVCVLAALHRQGVGQALVERAAEVAGERGVQHLYVHVVADNVPALKLYVQSAGFQQESEESEGFARALNRPRRLLLHKSLGQPCSV